MHKRDSCLDLLLTQRWREMVALFPGHSHLQFLIACSIGLWRGKTSGRQRVDMAVCLLVCLPDLLTFNQISRPSPLYLHTATY